MTRYLVTGGAGFIGSHIVQTLVDQGADVLVLDHFSTGKQENLSGLNGRLDILKGDVRDRSIVEQAVQDVDTIFHQAAFVSVSESMEKPKTCFDINVSATIALFDAARLAGVRRVVFASSAAVYGESDDLPLKENAPARPLSPYAASKRTIEIYGQVYTQVYGLEVVALRYFNVYGPRQRPNSTYAAAVPIFVRRLLDSKPVTIFGDGGQTRDLINVKDIVRANLIASMHPDAPGKIFNVCTGQGISILDLLKVLLNHFPGVPEPVFVESRAGDIYRSVGSTETIGQTLGFQAEVALKDGLEETVAWMQV